MTVHAKLAKIVAEVFGVKPEDLTLESDSTSVAKWDSVGHLKLMFKLEQDLGVKFNAKEIMGLTRVGLLQDALQKKGYLSPE